MYILSVCAVKDKFSTAVHTLWWVDVNEVRLRSEHELLQDDSEAVDVSFVSSVDRSSCHTQQLRCCPQLLTVKLKFVHLNNFKTQYNIR